MRRTRGSSTSSSFNFPPQFGQSELAVGGRIAARDERGSALTASGGRDEVTIEPNPLVRKSVQTGCLLGRESGGTEVASQVMRNQHHDVGRVLGTDRVARLFSQANGCVGGSGRSRGKTLFRDARDSGLSTGCGNVLTAGAVRGWFSPILERSALRVG